MAGRTWLAVALCMLVWYFWMKLNPPAPPPTEANPQTQTQQPGTPPPPVPQGPTNALFSKPIPEVPSKQATSGNLLVTFSDAGSKISEADVTTYHETTDPKSKYISPVSKEISAFDLATLFSDPALDEFSRGTYERQDDGAIVRYQKKVGDVSVTKEYQLNDGDYTIDAVYRIKFPPGQRKDWGFLLLPVGARTVENDPKDPLKSWEVVAYQNDSVTRKLTTKLDLGETVKQGNTGWLAFGNRYFSTVLINNADINPDVVFINTGEFVGGYLRYPLALREGQTDLALKTKIFIGPKSYTELSKFPGLRRLIDYGTFSFIAYPLLELLRFFYRYIHNYGIAIILLTILVRGIFFPLQQKATRSMKDMQKIQPQIAALKERYKDDPTRFNQEQMALFKAHKVNPAGSCLPMLVQLPVFFALYAVLGNSIELFHAPFFGWIHDLSAKDPFYILPVLMGVSMVAQQKLTPTAGMDPTQAKMMLIMPVVFTFIMASLPSGLTLYIFLSTILGVAQQLLTNREKGPSAPLNLRPVPGAARE